MRAGFTLLDTWKHSNGNQLYSDEKHTQIVMTCNLKNCSRQKRQQQK